MLLYICNKKKERINTMKAFVWSAKTEEEMTKEFNTLEDLYNFSLEVGHDLVFHPCDGNGDYDIEITIFDDYLDY